VDRPTPADLIRLQSRLAYSDCGPVEAVVATEVMLAAVEGKMLRSWKDIAADYGLDPSLLSRAKTRLGCRVVETPDGLRIDLDQGLWFPRTHRGLALQWLASRVLALASPEPTEADEPPQVIVRFPDPAFTPCSPDGGRAF
jgi:hypothetical protein